MLEIKNLKKKFGNKKVLNGVNLKVEKGDIIGIIGPSRGTPGCPASTRERPRETFFNTSRGQIPLPGLESNDAL